MKRLAILAAPLFSAARLFSAVPLLWIASCSPPAAATAKPATATLEWPVPAGWKHETIPFPLDFAPGLPFRGVEELRFAPGFFDPKSSTYWSYAFAWSLESPPRFDAPTLSATLREYFSGLATAVGKDKFRMDPQRFRVDLAPRNEDGRTMLAGKIESYDPFVTGEPIELEVEARLRDCPRAGGPVIVFLLSPKPIGDPVWGDLRACAAGFCCE